MARLEIYKDGKWQLEYEGAYRVESQIMHARLHCKGYEWRVIVNMMSGEFGEKVNTFVAAQSKNAPADTPAAEPVADEPTEPLTGVEMTVNTSPCGDSAKSKTIRFKLPAPTLLTTGHGRKARKSQKSRQNPRSKARKVSTIMMERNDKKQAALRAKYAAEHSTRYPNLLSINPRYWKMVVDTVNDMPMRKKAA